MWRCCETVKIKEEEETKKNKKEKKTKKSCEKKNHNFFFRILVPLHVFLFRFSPCFFVLEEEKKLTDTPRTRKKKKLFKKKKKMWMFVFSFLTLKKKPRQFHLRKFFLKYMDQFCGKEGFVLWACISCVDILKKGKLKKKKHQATEKKNFFLPHDDVSWESPISLEHAIGLHRNFFVVSFYCFQGWLVFEEVKQALGGLT